MELFMNKSSGGKIPPSLSSIEATGDFGCRITQTQNYMNSEHKHNADTRFAKSVWKVHVESV